MPSPATDPIADLAAATAGAEARVKALQDRVAELEGQVLPPEEVAALEALTARLRALAATSDPTPPAPADSGTSAPTPSPAVS